MASVTEKPQPESPPRPAERGGERLVDQHISRTRRSLKLVDLTVGMITLTIGVLAYLLTMALLEHWVIPGGWSDTARNLLFAGLLIGIAVYSWRTFWPLLRLSINPAYAAQAIELHSPSLKNSLLNLLLLRNHKRQLSRQVYRAIEQQAAQGLSQVKMESVVDRSAILRLGYILVALTAICALYRFLSPKDLITSAGRVLMPWSNIATPSRVQILDVTPGEAKAARGEQLEITAEVLGLEKDEPVRLLYSTADEQIVGQEVPMSSSAGGARFSCLVPGRIGMGGSARKSGGIQQDFSYWIEAGDARSPRYKVAVFARPTMVVNRLRYEYPSYTGYPTREVEHTGDIRAVEGTKVTLYAQANKPIKAAHVDFDADGRRDLLMNSTDQQATITFPLELRDDRRTPRYQGYVLRYQTTAGNQNQQPPKYQIDVQPDYSPEIQLLLPAEAMLEVALNQEVNFELDARDPDFALSQVMLIGKVGEEQRLQEELLNRNHTGRFVGKLRKTPAEIGLKVGEVMEYWGAAADNRRPEANLAYSAHRKLRVIGPWQGDKNGKPNQEDERQQQKGEGEEQQEGDGGQEGQTGAGEPGSSGEGEEGEQGQGANGQEGGEPNENSEQHEGQGESSSADGDSNGESQGGMQGDSPAENSENSNSQQENGESSDDPSAGGDGAEQGKVSSEGDDDSSAFERMAKHFDEQAGNKGEGSENTDQQQSGEGETADADQQAKSDSKAADGSPDKNQSGKPGENSEKQPQGESASADGQTETGEPEGDGAQGEPAAEEQKQGEGGEQQQQGGDSPAGEMSPEQGEAGPDDSNGEEQGAPNSDGAKKPQDKQGDQGNEPEQKDSEAASEARDNSESDSESSQGGDRSGGGKEGAGQQADADGKGGAGENQSADDGGGKASESGEGETGEQAGEKKPAEGKTGESSESQSGNGSEKSEQSGEQPGGAKSDANSAGEKQSGEPSETPPGEETNQPPPPGESASADGQTPAGDPAGGTGGKPSAPPPGGETQSGDEANLEYARQQTDLILDRLEDQLNKQEVDQSLLEKLGWTQDELRRFVDRWKDLKAQADDKSESTATNEELNAALRSLGLGRNRRTGFQSKISQDKLRDLQDAFRGRVPLEYQEQVNRYIKGTATAQPTSSQEGE